MDREVQKYIYIEGEREGGRKESLFLTFSAAGAGGEGSGSYCSSQAL